MMVKTSYLGGLPEGRFPPDGGRARRRDGLDRLDKLTCALYRKSNYTSWLEPRASHRRHGGRKLQWGKEVKPRISLSFDLQYRC